ncbi:MAG: alternative ribosome rescue aminoacyl-tRNA hydrolase ArfB [Prochlorococcus sp.]|jgi:ribosome-associated protein|nr:alternative ribosome rescue aminoacyl-tRNA hydrolase ArfB [Prochlorococcaceae cyanobacterium ETNP18_MAG_14]MDP6310025.1 alternative ribosome rescue aminoacyl-tRNA hydrolase ArfB [Prochlorococcaceae cyanobacterium ETNP14_MAG_4]|tara:strand:+ start:2498 stop:2929 length:432 start_codon:yes stop_codon:yes gene_type:complete
MPDLKVNPRLTIPAGELHWRFSRSSGPGGQGVNKTDSRVELLFDIETSSSIGPARKQRLIDRLGSRVVAGSIRVVVSEERSQYQNRQLALARMADLIRESLKPPSKTRKPTKPSRSAKKRRVESKKQRGVLKQKRQDKPTVDD